MQCPKVQKDFHSKIISFKRNDPPFLDIILLLEALFSTKKRRFVDEKAITNLRNKDRANFQILGLLSKVKTAF